MRVKICCIGSVEEARLAIHYGAHAIGLVSHMPSGAGVIPDERIREIARSLPPAIGSFLLTSRQEPDAIIDQQRSARVNTLQLVDRMALDHLRTLREQLPGVSLVQVVHVTGPEALDEAARVAPLVDAILLDSGNPNLPVKQLGGTGRVHNWDLSAQIVRSVSCPVFLAGGLRPDNVAQAIARVQPFAVDVCSGLRPRGYLDERLLVEFMYTVRRMAGI
ncbi:MAG: phosphoribosylanthranilate isomerase [Candidatus Marinimicrobia bacterium]|nr:phosphoribosylanthranilate isomerase [Candidatus Neomarinimicrobiota bacterium]